MNTLRSMFAHQRFFGHLFAHEPSPKRVATPPKSFLPQRPCTGRPVAGLAAAPEVLGYFTRTHKSGPGFPRTTESGTGRSSALFRSKDGRGCWMFFWQPVSTPKLHPKRY